jgi:hypothetical protein
MGLAEWIREAALFDGEHDRPPSAGSRTRERQLSSPQSMAVLPGRGPAAGLEDIGVGRVLREGRLTLGRSRTILMT